MDTNSLYRILGEKTFIIAEIGQNHQGDINIAKQLIKTAKECGADCVKFQKSNLKEKFTDAVLDRPYDSPNSFGKTYGEHKRYLEFSEDQYKVLQSYAKGMDIAFTASAMDVTSLEFLIAIKVPFIKIGSGDSNNFLMIEKAAQKFIPLVISTGMQSFETVKQIYTTVSKYHKEFALLHCVSAYPTPVEEINLKVLKLYQEEFPDITIGYSGHELGIDVTLAAVALGSKIIERHITLDKNQKGTDHICSLEPSEFKQMVTKIRFLEKALGKPAKDIQPSEIPCLQKLGKCIVYSRRLLKGHKLEPGDLKIKVSMHKRVLGSELVKMYGRILNKDVNEDESLETDHML